MKKPKNRRYGKRDIKRLIDLVEAIPVEQRKKYLRGKARKTPLLTKQFQKILPISMKDILLAAFNDAETSLGLTRPLKSHEHKRVYRKVELLLEKELLKAVRGKGRPKKTTVHSFESLCRRRSNGVLENATGE